MITAYAQQLTAVRWCVAFVRECDCLGSRVKLCVCVCVCLCVCVRVLLLARSVAMLERRWNLQLANGCLRVRMRAHAWVQECSAAQCAPPSPLLLVQMCGASDGGSDLQRDLPEQCALRRRGCHDWRLDGYLD